MDKNQDISSLNLRDSYDIYRTLLEYSFSTNSEMKSDLFFHIKELFIEYLKENNYDIYQFYGKESLLYMPMKLFDSNKKRMRIDVITNYEKTEQLLNPNSDDYIMEYIRLFNKCGYKIKNYKDYDYYNELEMNEFNHYFSFDIDTIYYPFDLIDTYNKRREINKLPKLYKYVVNEAIYTNDYLNVNINETDDENSYKNIIGILYDEKTNDKTFIIYQVFSTCGISQLLHLLSYYSISQNEKNLYDYTRYESIIIIKALKEGILDSLTTLNGYRNMNNFKSLFPMNIVSMIDSIQIHKIDSTQNETLAFLLDDLAYKYLIHIDGIDSMIYYIPHLKELLEKDLISIHKLCINSSDSVNIKKLDYIICYKHNIECLDITFQNNKQQDDIISEIDVNNSLTRFLKNSLLEHLNSFTIKFCDNLSIEYLTWISSLFNENKINTMHELFFDLPNIKKDLSSEYLTIYENIMEKLIPKASIVRIDIINDIPDDNFCELYTKNNFHQLKSIKLNKYRIKKLWTDFILKLCNYIHNKNFLSSTTIQLSDFISSSNDYIYDPNTSIFRYKQDTHSFMDTIKCTNDKVITEYEIEALFDCINENKTQYLRSLEICVYNEEQLSKIINFINNGKIPKLKEFIIYICEIISNNRFCVYKQQLNDSIFINENHVKYDLNTIY
ncbi:hypothetical protein WA158_005891 [Blastocystis sp. Blastoise]